MFDYFKHIPSQNYTMMMVREWKKCLDKKGSCGALLTDNSKAFDSLPHKPLLAKLGFNVLVMILLNPNLSGSGGFFIPLLSFP